MLTTRSIARSENSVLFSVPSASVWVENAPRDYLATIIYAVVMTVMLYDILLTLDDEVGISAYGVAGSKWSSTKVIFLVVRYFPLSIYFFGVIAFMFPSNSTCSTWKWYGSIGCIIVVAAADMFLAYRVYAFCGENKYLLVFLVITFFGWEATVVSLTALFLPHGVAVLDPVLQLNFFVGLVCIPVAYPPKIAIIWIGMLCYQSILFLYLILNALYKHCIIHYGIWFLGSRQAPLYRVLMRDGFWAYFLMVVTLVLNVVSIFKMKVLGNHPFTILFTVVTSICCCRLILNLRSVAYKPMSDIPIYVDLSLT